MKNYQKIAVIAALDNIDANNKKDQLLKKYNFIDLDKNPNADADLIITLGGDGLMLRILHKYENNPIPLYGMNCGTIGFLMNNYSDEDLYQTLNNAHTSNINPLRMDAITADHKTHRHIAINEVSLLRQTSQAAKIGIKIDSNSRLASLTADGILVATPAGSTAYNLSLQGPIIPFGSKMLALTPISPFRPRNWHGAILPSRYKIEFEILESEKRPVSATADSTEVRNVKEVRVSEDFSLTFTLLFDPKHSLEERIIREQFAPL